jgi:2-methylcitrate dehydratase PrpD
MVSARAEMFQAGFACFAFRIGQRARDIVRAHEGTRTVKSFNPRRRELLQTAAGVFAVSALSRGVSAAPSVSPLMATLSNYMSSAAGRALPEAAAEKAKQCILDTLAAMISGSTLPPGRFAIQFARSYGGNRICTVAGSNVMCGPIEAALANGLLAHSDETDDTHPPSQSHPGCAVVPAALAAGEKFGIGGAHFLRAVALGYDIGPRFTITLGKLEYMVDTHRSTHALSSEFGAAAAAGCAARLNPQQMRWLISWTAQQASGLASWQRDTDHIEKAFDFAGMGAKAGVTAALLVQAGATGVDDVLSGPDNFFEVFGPKNDLSLLVEKLGERYEVTRIQVKKWTVGSPIQAPLDAIDAMLKKRPFTPDQVKQVSVRVATNEAKVVDNREIPDICLQHMVAVMLLDKTASFKSAHDVARMKDPAVLRQREKISLIRDDELEKRMPAREAIVELELTDGTKLTEHIIAVRGTPDNPMTRQELIAKAQDLIAPVLGTQTFSKLSQKIFEIETIGNVRELRPLLQMA